MRQRARPKVALHNSPFSHEDNGVNVAPHGLARRLRQRGTVGRKDKGRADQGEVEGDADDDARGVGRAVEKPKRNHT